MRTSEALEVLRRTLLAADAVPSTPSPAPAPAPAPPPTAPPAGPAAITHLSQLLPASVTSALARFDQAQRQAEADREAEVEAAWARWERTAFGMAHPETHDLPVGSALAAPAADDLAWLREGYGDHGSAHL